MQLPAILVRIKASIPPRERDAMFSLGNRAFAVRFWLVVAIGATSLARPASADDAATKIDFVRDIQPILRTHCYDCHGPTTQESGLRLSNRKSALLGGDSGEKSIVPGQPDASRLIKLVRGDDPKHLMPPPDLGVPLTAEQIALLVRWVEQGADWPESADEQAEKPTHWAWQRPVRPPLPAVRQLDWPRNGIDYFVLARLEAEGLTPSAEADRYMLLRRVYLDLIGLPPSPDDVDAFVADTRPDAYEQVVDRLLADPAYGERWAGMWLDLARYADSKGYGSDPLRTIWRYRDWVIGAFNRNLPYDQFTIEQIAGDMLPGATADQVLATAFHRNTMANDEGGTDDEEFRVAAIKDRVDTTCQVWMGLTMGCAKCHSHKYDPISQREYYQFYAFLNQTEDADRGDESPRVATPTDQQIARRGELDSQLTALRQQLDAPSAELIAALATGQARWEQAVAEQEKTWVVLEPVEATATGGTTLERQPDGSLLASGESPDTDTYTVAVETPLSGITAFRLELLPDERLPGGGPGRVPGGGNLVLNDLKATVAPLGREPSGLAGRYVRVDLPGTARLLSLAEVQVFRGADNIALSGKATQSSVEYDGPPQLAIDGNTDGHYFDAKSTTHTAQEDNPWWEVDLGSIGDVNRIVLWNRTDNGAGTRLFNFRVSLLDADRNPVWEQTVAQPPNPSVDFTLGGPLAVALEGATADFEQDGWPAAKAIDADATSASGWAIAPQVNQRHVAVFQAANPVGGEAGTRLTFTLAQLFGGQHTIGRFRISATTAARPVQALPGAIAEILATAPDARTAEQAAALAAHYRAKAAELRDLRNQVAAVEAQRAELEKQIPTTPIMRELAADQRRTTRMMVKGNFLNPADAVEPAVPEAFHPLPADAAADRLGLARWLVSPENPLTARVAVNRFWAQLFGAGLVETQEDFGTQGLPPSHPELLDWLAIEFMEGAGRGQPGAPTALPWDIRALLRLIVTSATYRQTSTAAPALLQRDPNNRLLARGPRFRLEAEMVRDQALAISGLLSRKQGGPSVYPPQPDGLWRAAFNGERTWATSTGEDRYRRGLYTYWRRTVPYPSMAAFDAPSREICTVRRISTNTPLQAFVTLNDPVYVELAQALARRMVAEGGSTPEDRARFGLRLCLCRPPHDAQVAQVVALYQKELDHYRQDATAAMQLATNPLGPLPEGQDPAELAAWTVVANVLMNLDGVLTKR
jgi:mono/diheme cytochrome c family protein